MITTRKLDTPELIDDACALLYKSHIEGVEWNFAENNPSKLRIEKHGNRNLLMDRFTNYAVWFGAFDGDKLIGCTRLTPPDDSNQLEVEGYPESMVIHAFLPIDRRQCVESTRTAVAKEYSGQGIVRRLLLATFTYCQNNHLSLAACVSNSYLKKLLKQINYPLKMEHAFKYEPQDPLPVNFYFADYSNGEVNRVVESLSEIGSDPQQSSKLIFKALELVAPILPTPVYWHDINGVVLGVNEHCIRSMGAKSSSDIIGKTPYDFYPKRIAEQILGHNQLVIKKGETLSQDEKIEDITTGNVRYFRNIKSPLYNDEGIIIGVIGAAMEVTAEKEAEKLKLENQKQRIENERYKAINEQQEKFRQRVDRVVHDIRSPLSSLLMLANYCTELEEDNRDMLKIATNRLQDIANDLLRDYTPKNMQKHDFAQPTLVSTILLEILSEKRSQYINAPLEFNHQFDFDSGFAFININRSDFSRAISNLVNNAVDAFEESKADGSISLVLDADDDSVTLKIEDNGKGMPQHIVNKLLNNISVTAGKKDGHGIGFTQVYDTLKSGNGKLDINSKEGIGTTIALTFPRIKAPEWIAESIKLNRDDIIMVVDDDQSVHKAWDARFKIIRKQAPDIQVWHFGSTRQAKNFVDNLSDKGKSKILLLIDYEFVKEDINGLEFIEQNDVSRVILVTSYYGKDKIRDKAVATNTKILPKTLAPTILVTFNDPERNIEYKRVDLVLVDDDKTFINDFIGMRPPGLMVDTYSDPELFLTKLELYAKNTKILLDNVFPQFDTDGVDIAKNLHEQGYKNIFVITGQPYKKKVPGYVKLIAKEEISELLAKL